MTTSSTPKNGHDNMFGRKILFWKWHEIRRTDDQLYMTRLYIFRCVWFAIMIHWFHASDEPVCSHDHPWSWISFIVSGGYWEETDSGSKWYGPGRILVRPATWRHRIDIDQRRPAITFVVRGPVKRAWGFYTPSGWIPWRQYDYKRDCG